MTEYPYKQAFREACRSRGINPVEGANSFQVVEYLTCEAKRTHYARCEAQVYEHAERCPLNWDDGYGGVDEVKVMDKASRSWWQDPFMWNGAYSLCTIRRFQNTKYETYLINGVIEQPTAVKAVLNVRSEAKVLNVARIRRLRAERWTAYRSIVREAMLEARIGVSSP